MGGTERFIQRPQAGEISGPSVLRQFAIDLPLTLVIFGAAGDLTARKLVPGLFSMFQAGLLPAEFALVCNSRRMKSDAEVRDRMALAIREFGESEVREQELSRFLGMIHNHCGDLGDPACYSSLRDMIGAGGHFPANRLFYLAIGPEYFGPVIGHLAHAGLMYPDQNEPWSRVIIEKPFGRDLASAQALNAEILAHVPERQIYRIDHFLGKETVQNILAFRFANAIFEPVFNNRYVDHVQISATETVGMEGGRGAYYDQSGALRDMVQNHLLQLFCLVAMEPPSGFSAGAIHSEKIKVLSSVVPPEGRELRDHVVRGRYTQGWMGGQAVPGFLAEDRVSRESQTETYTAFRLKVDNWRWAGVPFYLRTGKRLKSRATSIRVVFKTPPKRLFQTVECAGDVCDLASAKPNALVFRIQPDEGISLRFSTKRPSMQMVVEDVDMDFNYAGTWNRKLPSAYERLLLDAMRGDATLFTRSDEVEAAWKIVDPILAAWVTRQDIPMHTYEVGTWGPDAADSIFHRKDMGWFNA